MKKSLLTTTLLKAVALIPSSILAIGISSCSNIEVSNSITLQEFDAEIVKRKKTINENGKYESFEPITIEELTKRTDKIRECVERAPESWEKVSMQHIDQLLFNKNELLKLTNEKIVEFVSSQKFSYKIQPKDPNYTAFPNLEKFHFFHNAKRPAFNFESLGKEFIAIAEKSNWIYFECDDYMIHQEKNVRNFFYLSKLSETMVHFFVKMCTTSVSDLLKIPTKHKLDSGSFYGKSLSYIHPSVGIWDSDEKNNSVWDLQDLHKETLVEGSLEYIDNLLHFSSSEESKKIYFKIVQNTSKEIENRWFNTLLNYIGKSRNALKEHVQRVIILIDPEYNVAIAHEENETLNDEIWHINLENIVSDLSKG